MPMLLWNSSARPYEDSEIGVVLRCGGGGFAADVAPGPGLLLQSVEADLRALASRQVVE